MRDYLNAFKTYLKAHDSKLTEQRRIILDTVFSIHDHFNAESLYNLVCTNGQNKGVSLTSIYRTLPLLIGAGLIKRSPGDPSKEQYEHTYGHPDHCHMECSDCGAIIEKKVSSKQRAALLDMTNPAGYQPTSVEIHFYGYCKSCQASRKKKEGGKSS